MEGKAQREGASSGKRLTVTMEVDTLDCPICFEPLMPPIFQCSVGHFICSSCRQKVAQNKCHICSAQTTFRRCFGMEKVMESVTVPCSYAKYGCTQRITYYQKEEHEDVCQNIPCFCPESGCGFGGPTAALIDHFKSVHKWSSTTIKYSKSVEFCIQPGFHVLYTKDKQILLLNVAKEPSGHTFSVVCIQPKAVESKLHCVMTYGRLFGGYSQKSSFKIKSSSLSDGLPKGYNVILPKDGVSDDGNDIVVSIAIHDLRPAKPGERQPICLKPVGDV